LWEARTKGQQRCWIVASPDGRRIFVAGQRIGSTTDQDFATIAADAATGRKLWVAVYDGPGHNTDQVSSIVVSPDGKEVFVTGTAFSWSSGLDFVSIAYDATTGQELWLGRFNRGFDIPKSAAMSPDGGALFITGYSQTLGGSYDYTTVAIDTMTGHRLWAALYRPWGKQGSDMGLSVAVSPDARTVFVTGSSEGPSTAEDYATLAYDTASGRQLWVARYDGPASDTDFASSVAASPDGTSVFVTGASKGVDSSYDYATLAYDAASGRKLWAALYNGPADNDDSAKMVVASPDGGAVFVVGFSVGRTHSGDSATLAFDAATGRVLWQARYNGTGNGWDQGDSLVASADGAKVFVVGQSVGSTTGNDFVTLAYDSATGGQIWTARYDGGPEFEDSGMSIAASPDGTRVFVCGWSITNHRGGYAIVAYQG
jgi:WD40 repeat protein